MHECPDCGQACDCDGEDIWWDNYDECEHYLDPDCRGEDYFDDYDDWDDYEEVQPVAAETADTTQPDDFEDGT
jgi:hypothetical protein